MKQFNTCKLILLSFLSFTLQNLFGQTIVSQETFPNLFNTGFGNPATNKSNASFTGSIDSWSASANTTAAIAVIQAFYSPVTKAIKIVNWNTAGLAAGDCGAVSPTINLSNLNCTPSMNLTFKLYTHACAAADLNTTLEFDFSNDNGSKWANAYNITSAAMFTTWGLDNITTISIPVTASYRVANFRLQKEMVQPGGNNIVVKNVSGLPGGIYYLEVITAEKTFKTKIIKE